MTRPLREVTTYLVIAFSIAIGIAVAIPHAGINVLLSAFIPAVTVLVVTFTVTPRGSRRSLWRSFGLRRSGRHLWPLALLVPMVLAGSAYAVAIAVGVAELRDLDLTSSSAAAWVLDLIFMCVFMLVS